MILIKSNYLQLLLKLGIIIKPITSFQILKYNSRLKCSFSRLYQVAYTVGTVLVKARDRGHRLHLGQDEARSSCIVAKNGIKIGIPRGQGQELSSFLKKAL